MAKKVSRESKIIRFLKLPIRALRKTKDLYIQALMQCAGKMGNAGGMGGPTTALPKSFSINSTNSSYDDDLRELIRAASTRTMGIKIEDEVLRRQSLARSEFVPRSMSLVGIGRIDEEKPFEVFDEVVRVKSDLAVPRSRSYAVLR